MKIFTSLWERRASIGARYDTKDSEAVRVARVFVLSARSRTDAPSARRSRFFSMEGA